MELVESVDLKKFNIIHYTKFVSVYVCEQWGGIWKLDHIAHLEYFMY